MIEGYKVFRRDRQGRRGGEVALYDKKQMDCKGLPLKNGCDQIGGLWIEIRDQTNIWWSSDQGGCEGA